MTKGREEFNLEIIPNKNIRIQVLTTSINSNLKKKLAIEGRRKINLNIKTYAKT
jgi:hypothetical protein